MYSDYTIGHIQSNYITTCERLNKCFKTQLKEFDSRWSEEQKSKYVESVLLGLDNSCFFILSNYQKELVFIIDGRERVKALIEFLLGDLSLSYVIYNQDFKNTKFEDLKDDISLFYGETQNIKTYNSNNINVNTLYKMYTSLNCRLNVHSQEVFTNEYLKTLGE